VGQHTFSVFGGLHRLQAGAVRPADVRQRDNDYRFPIPDITANRAAGFPHIPVFGECAVRARIFVADVGESVFTGGGFDYDSGGRGDAVRADIEFGNRKNVQTGRHREKYGNPEFMRDAGQFLRAAAGGLFARPVPESAAAGMGADCGAGFRGGGGVSVVARLFPHRSERGKIGDEIWKSKLN